ncbi:MAG: PH domain-containing protein, partial [Actinomycetota bacterium]
LDLWPVIGDAFGWLAAAVTVFAASRVLRWWRKSYAVTDLRVLSAGGLLASHVRSASLAKASDVTINRSPAGRLLGYGDVVVRSAGGASFRFRTIGRPKQIYRLISELVAGRPAEARTGQAPPVLPDPALEKTGPLPRVIL